MAEASSSPAVSPAPASAPAKGSARGALLLPLSIAIVGLIVMFAGPPVAGAVKAAVRSEWIDPIQTGSIHVAAPDATARHPAKSWDSGYGVDD